MFQLFQSTEALFVWNELLNYQWQLCVLKIEQIIVMMNGEWYFFNQKKKKRGVDAASGGNAVCCVVRIPF